MTEKLHASIEKSHFAIFTRKGIEKINFDDILYFESEGRKIHVHTIERKISFNGSIENLRKKLDSRFISCHCSYEVNLTKVKRFAGGCIEVEGGAILPVSQRRFSETKRSYYTYLIKHFPCNLEDDIV